MKIIIADNAAQIITPYNADFVAAIKKIGGAKWNPATKVWSVPVSAVEPVRAIMRDVYGEDDRPDASERVTVKLTFSRSVYEPRGSVTILAKCLSYARGRDSGATPGQDVAYIAGGPTSGGSVKNWQSIVESGSVAILSNVPRALYDGAELPDGVTSELIEAVSPDRSALVQERERLLARVDEIDALLISEEA